MAYLGRYTHRVALSNDRLVALRDGQVMFRWRERRHSNRLKVMTLLRRSSSDASSSTSYPQDSCAFATMGWWAIGVGRRNWQHAAARWRSQRRPCCPENPLRP